MNSATNSLGRHALTVNVEDYFHVSAFRHAIPYGNWNDKESRVERNTHTVLELLEEFHFHATFFILGWVAERYPSLVRGIQAAGRELGCHSYAHRLVYELTPEEFRADTGRALCAIEDIAGLRVRAYRAPSFSITARSLWALEISLELGLTADSSIFPSATGLTVFRCASTALPNSCQRQGPLGVPAGHPENRRMQRSRDRRRLFASPAVSFPGARAHADGQSRGVYRALLSPVGTRPCSGPSCCSTGPEVLPLYGTEPRRGPCAATVQEVPFGCLSEATQNLPSLCELKLSAPLEPSIPL